MNETIFVNKYNNTKNQSTSHFWLVPQLVAHSKASVTLDLILDFAASWCCTKHQNREVATGDTGSAFLMTVSWCGCWWVWLLAAHWTRQFRRGTWDATVRRNRVRGVQAVVVHFCHVPHAIIVEGIHLKAQNFSKHASVFGRVESIVRVCSSTAGNLHNRFVYKEPRTQKEEENTAISSQRPC